MTTKIFLVAGTALAGTFLLFKLKKAQAQKTPSRPAPTAKTLPPAATGTPARKPTPILPPPFMPVMPALSKTEVQKAIEKVHEELKTKSRVTLPEPVRRVNKEAEKLPTKQSLEARREIARRLHGYSKPAWDNIMKKAREQEHRKTIMIREAIKTGRAEIIRRGAWVTIKVGHYTISAPAWLARRLYGVP